MSLDLKNTAQHCIPTGAVMFTINLNKSVGRGACGTLNSQLTLTRKMSVPGIRDLRASRFITPASSHGLTV